MPRLLLVTRAELTRDPRARRATDAALESGWDVTGLCVGVGGRPVPLHDIRVIRVGTEALDAALRGAGLGGGRRDHPAVRELRGVYRLWRLLYRTIGLVAAGRSVEQAEVLHANDFETLPAGTWLARRLGARLVYDAHELYAWQEADPPRLYRMLTLRLERALARRADAVVTVSEPIARELQRVLGLRERPTVVLNCPARSAGAAPAETGSPLRAVYQGAVGLGRSLDDLLDAAGSLQHVTLSLRVVGRDTAGLRALVRQRGLEHSVDVLEPVDPGALVDSLMGFDVGILATRPLSLNDELAVPNKLFEYLMAGLAVVVPRLPGVMQILADEPVGGAYEPGSPVSLAETLSRLAARPLDVAAAKARARALALERFNAEAQRPALLSAWCG